VSPELHAASPAVTEREPTAASVAAPVWLFVVLGVMIYWGMGYVERNGGGFHEKVYEPYRSFTELDRLQPRAAVDPLFERGRKAYATYCQACHQASGLGAPGVAPPLAASEWVLAEGPNRMIRIVLHGLQGPITVKGQEWNLNMLAWREVIRDDAEIAAILTYVRQNSEWGNAASPVTPEQVSAIRKATESRTDQWTAPELLQLPAKD
jgi:mono/diheme cytochrome c family protein